MIKLGEGFLEGPEDVSMDKEGIIYTATRDGWIKRLHKNGSWENWKMLEGDTLLGITTTNEGDLVVCDSEKVNFNLKTNIIVFSAINLQREKKWLFS